MTTAAKKPVFLIDSPRRLPLGTVLRVWLDQNVEFYPGKPDPGPHPVGKAEVMDDGRLAVWLIEATTAGRTAKGLVADDILDFVVEGDPPAVWLRA